MLELQNGRFFFWGQLTIPQPAKKSMIVKIAALPVNALQGLHLLLLWEMFLPTLRCSNDFIADVPRIISLSFLSF